MLNLDVWIVMWQQPNGSFYIQRDLFDLIVFVIIVNSFTIRILQEAEVIQLTDGGKCFSATLQLFAEVEVTRPIAAQAWTCYVAAYRQHHED